MEWKARIYKIQFQFNISIPIHTYTVVIELDDPFITRSRCGKMVRVIYKWLCGGKLGFWRGHPFLRRLGGGWFLSPNACIWTPKRMRSKKAPMNLYLNPMNPTRNLMQKISQGGGGYKPVVDIHRGRRCEIKLTDCLWNYLTILDLPLRLIRCYINRSYVIGVG